MIKGVIHHIKWDLAHPVDRITAAQWRLLEHWLKVWS